MRFRTLVRFSASLFLTFFLSGLLLTAFYKVAQPSVTQAAETWDPNAVFYDDFTGAAGTAPDPTKWGYDIGTGANHDGWGNGELEYYTNSTNNCYQDGSGHLVIKAIKENYGSGSDARSYTSCRLVTKNKGDWENGRIEVRAKLPVGGKGIWPAIWMLPTDSLYGIWPRSGETDIMEMVGNDPLTVYGTIHYGVPWVHKGQPYTLPNTGYHTYALEWDENEIRWYVDNLLYETRDANEWYSSSAGRPAPFDQRFHLLMNLAVGGQWPGSPDASTPFPQEMDVDYVKVQQRPGTHTKPIPGKIQAERYAAANAAQVEATSDTGAGQDVGSMNAGSYLDYNVNVAQAGLYTVEYRVASPNATGKFDISLDGTRLDSLTVPNTGGWQNWQTITDEINLPTGNHTLRVTQTAYGFNLNWLRFLTAGTRTVYDFENFDQDEYFGTYTSGGSTVTVSKVTTPKTQGNYALRMDYSQVAGGVGEWFERFYQDWHYATGIKLDVYGQNSGRQVSVGLEDTADERFEYHFLDNFSGWQTLTIPFTSFFRSTGYQPSDAPNDGLDRQDVNAINFSVLDAGAGTLYIDNIVLYEGSSTGPTPTPTATPGPTATPTPTPTATPTPTPVTGGTNIALNKTATASSTENVGTPASSAVDGNTGTRWSSAFSDPQWLQVDLGATYNINKVVLNWETAYGKAYQIQVSPDGTNWTTIYNTTTGAGGIETLNVTGTGRYVRMYGTARATAYGYSLWEFQVYGTAATATNLALNKTATASSTENAGSPAGNAVDGNTGTRWSSAFSDPQWLQVDLGATYSISKVVLNWETAYGKAYQIQTSNDGTNWTTIYSTTTGAGGIETLNVSGSGRYVRMYGTARATGYGYSLWEFQVFGS